MGEKIKELKNWLKSSEIEIRTTKNLYKNCQRNNKGIDIILGTLIKLRTEYRHKHIAYSELRGRSRIQIENPRQGNEPDESLIQSIKDEYKEETLRAGA